MEQIPGCTLIMGWWGRLRGERNGIESPDAGYSDVLEICVDDACWIAQAKTCGYRFMICALWVRPVRPCALKHEVLQSPCIWVGNSVSHDLPQERGGEEAVLCGWRGLVWCDAPQGWQIFSNGRWTLGTGKEWVYYNEPIVVFHFIHNLYTLRFDLWDIAKWSSL